MLKFPAMRDWFGEPAGFALEYSLEVAGPRLQFHFSTGWPPSCDPEARGFVSGLWERDVAEFFLMAEDGSYQEFNLSPTGAWWSARFRGYRDLLREDQCPSVATGAHSTTEGWSAWLSVELRDLIEWKKTNVCAILGGRFFCAGHSSGGQPDFHLASNFG